MINVQIRIAVITAQATTKNDLFKSGPEGSEDEIYFRVDQGTNGAAPQAGKRVPPNFNYDIEDNKSLVDGQVSESNDKQRFDGLLQEFQVSDGRAQIFNIFVAEDDDNIGGIFEGIGDIATGLVEGATALATGFPAVLAGEYAAFQTIKKGVSEVADAIKNGGDQPIGSFSISATSFEGRPVVAWATYDDVRTKLVSVEPDNNRAKYEATDSGASYTFEVIAKFPQSLFSSTSSSLIGSDGKNLVDEE